MVKIMDEYVSRKSKDYIMFLFAFGAIWKMNPLMGAMRK